MMAMVFVGGNFQGSALQGEKIDGENVNYDNYSIDNFYNNKYEKKLNNQLREGPTMEQWVVW